MINMVNKQVEVILEILENKRTIIMDLTKGILNFNIGLFSAVSDGMKKDTIRFKYMYTILLKLMI